MKYYLICSQPRSGTQLLRRLLTCVGVGNPIELYYELFKHSRGNSSLQIDNLESIYEVCAQNDIWGAVAHYLHFSTGMKVLKNISGMHSLSSYPLLNSLFPNIKFIYFYRIDKVKQAISWVKAEQSNHFLCHQLDDFDGHTYSEEDISERILTLVRGETQWLHFFNKYNIVPYYLTYESLCDDKVKSVEGILDFLNLRFVSDEPLAEFISRIQLTVQQHDAVNVEWYRKYTSSEW